MMLKIKNMNNSNFLAKSFFLLFFVLYAAINFAQNYDAANNFYAEGNYEEAIVEYQQLIVDDIISSDIYYNLGNAYYKLDNIPEAILNYEKALKLEPAHEDALFNLKMANKKTIDKVERLPELFIENTWNTFVTSKTISNWAYYAVALLFLSLILFISYIYSKQIIIKKGGFYAGGLFLVLALFCWLMAAQHQNIVNSSTQAIIFNPSVTILSEPNENAENLFTLHEGTKVSVLEEQNNWKKIKLPNGNVGWIKAVDIKNI